MSFKKLFRKPNKRQECIEMIKEMAAVMSFPDDSQKALREDLDLSVATDEQVEIIHKGLLELKKKYNASRQQYLFKRINAIQN